MRVSPNASGSAPRCCASHVAVTLTQRGSLRRLGAPGGDRYGESVSTSSRSTGTSRATEALTSSPARKTRPLKLIASPDEECGEVPKAFVVLKGQATSDEVMAYVAARVAPYKKIRRIEFIDAIPKSASGKILRRVLIERERAARSSS